VNDDHKIPSELSRAIHAQIDHESVFAQSSDTPDRNQRKERRLAALQAWAGQLEDPELRHAYLRILEHAGRSLADWRERWAHEQRALSIELPPLPPELR
jgi:hypothetical protein